MAQGPATQPRNGKGRDLGHPEQQYVGPATAWSIAHEQHLREAAEQQTDNIGSLNKAAANLTRGGMLAELKEKIGRNFSGGLKVKTSFPSKLHHG